MLTSSRGLFQHNHCLLKDMFTMIGLIGVVFYRDWKLAIVASDLPFSYYSYQGIWKEASKIQPQESTANGLYYHLSA